MIGHAVVRPAREVKLPDLPDLVSPSLKREETRVMVLDTQSAAEGGGECGERREETVCRRFPEVRPKQTQIQSEYKRALYGHCGRGFDQSFYYPASCATHGESCSFCRFSIF